MNNPTQMMSSACQNRLKQSSRRSTIGRKPLVATCAIMTASQSSPKVTCTPWQPTNVKNAERNALRSGVAPIMTMPANSLASSARNAAPSRKVTAAAR